MQFPQGRMVVTNFLNFLLVAPHFDGHPSRIAHELHSKQVLEAGGQFFRALVAKLP